MKTLRRLLAAAALLLCCAAYLKAQDSIYVDPIYNGSTDPMVC